MQNPYLLYLSGQFHKDVILQRLQLMSYASIPVCCNVTSLFNGLRKVMGSIPTGDFVFSDDMLNLHRSMLIMVELQ